MRESGLAKGQKYCSESYHWKPTKKLERFCNTGPLYNMHMQEQKGGKELRGGDWGRKKELAENVAQLEAQEIRTKIQENEWHHKIWRDWVILILTKIPKKKFKPYSVSDYICGLDWRSSAGVTWCMALVWNVTFLVHVIGSDPSQHNM